MVAPPANTFTSQPQNPPGKLVEALLATSSLHHPLHLSGSPFPASAADLANLATRQSPPAPQRSSRNLQDVRVDFPIIFTSTDIHHEAHLHGALFTPFTMSSLEGRPFRQVSCYLFGHWSSTCLPCKPAPVARFPTTPQQRLPPPV